MYTYICYSILNKIQINWKILAHLWACIWPFQNTCEFNICDISLGRPPLFMYLLTSMDFMPIMIFSPVANLKKLKKRRTSLMNVPNNYGSLQCNRSGSFYCKKGCNVITKEVL